MSVAASASTSDSNLRTSRLHELKRRSEQALNALTKGFADIKKRRTQSIEQTDSQLAALESYKRCIRTFSVGKWTVSELTPRSMASHGWELVKGSTCRCIGCNVFVAIDIPSLEKVESECYDACLRSAKKSVTCSHLETCVYRTLQPTFLLSMTDKSSDRDEIERKLALYEPYQLPEFDVPAQVVDLSASCDSHSIESVTCACLGWTIVSSTIARKTIPQMHCDLCNRSVPIRASFDPVASHMPWCPNLDRDGNLSSKPHYWISRMKMFLSKSNEKLLSSVPIATAFLDSAISRTL